MKIINVKSTELPLPIGEPLHPYETRVMNDADWMVVSHDRIVAAWIKAGIIQVMPSTTPKTTWRDRLTTPESKDDELSS